MESDVCVLKTGVEASSNPCGLAVPYPSMCGGQERTMLLAVM
jgi:hypothetical protein